MSGAQSPMPGRHTSESGPTSPASHFFFTSASGSGPTWACPIATYHSVAAGAPRAEANTWPRRRTPIACVAPRSGLAAAGAGACCGGSPKAWSKALPSSASSPGPGAAGAAAAGFGGAAVGDAPDDDDVPALLAADLHPVRTDLVVRDHVLRAAAVAGEFHCGVRRGSYGWPVRSVKDAPPFTRRGTRGRASPGGVAYSSDTQNTREVAQPHLLPQLRHLRLLLHDPAAHDLEVAREERPDAVRGELRAVEVGAHVAGVLHVAVGAGEQLEGVLADVLGERPLELPLQLLDDVRVRGDDEVRGAGRAGRLEHEVELVVRHEPREEQLGPPERHRLADREPELLLRAAR